MSTAQKFSIESNVPIPKTRAVYPFRDMKLKESFFVDNGKLRSKRKSFYATVSNAGKRLGRKFVVRDMGGGFRVWRIK